MFFKYLLLDLDNTIYDYNLCHNEAINSIIQKLQLKCNKSVQELQNLYDSISTKLKYELKQTASSHNKFIYIKHLLEHLNMDLSYCVYYEKMYWDIFFNHMCCFDGILEFIKWIKSENIKIAIITDYETEYQIQKLEKLGLLSYIDHIITSEEVGIEKPSKLIFLSAIHILNCKTEEVIMIGDNFDKDIIGAINLDICAFWFHKNNNNSFHKHNNYFEFNHFKELYLYFTNCKTEIQRLEYISKYCGERFDLTQAGGGNTSVKYKDFMFIKASGYHLTQVNQINGYISINNEILKQDIYDNNTKSIIEYNIIGSLRASIETYMHSILKKYTIHLHPIQVNQVLVSQRCDDFIKEYFPNSLLIEYDTPGINVCNKIMNVYNNEEIIFLKNHGIIVTTDDYDTLIPTLESLLSIFETKLQINLDKYKFVNQISKHINNSYENVSYLCEDKIVNQYLYDKKHMFQEKITFPDALIFCGLKILFIDDLKEIDNYFEKYDEFPKVIVIDNLIYIINIFLQKCKDTEDVLKGNLMTLDNDMEKTYLTNEEICYLNNWDAEKYRKTI